MVRPLEEKLRSLLGEDTQGVQVLRVEVSDQMVLDLNGLGEFTPRIRFGRIPKGPPVDPLFPLTFWILEGYRTLGPKEKQLFWETINPYILHKPLLNAWLEGRTTERWDDLLRLHEEMQCERRLLWTSLWKMLCTLYPPRGRALVVEGFQNASADLRRFLAHGLETFGNTGPLMVMILTGGGSLLSDDFPGEGNFLTRLEEEGRISHIPLKAAEKPLGPEEGTAAQSLEGFFQRRVLLCWESEVPPPPKGSKEARTRYYVERGLLEYSSERFNNAVVSLQTALSLCRGQGDDAWWISLLLALVYHRKNDRPQMEKSMARALRLVPRDLTEEKQDFILAARVHFFAGHWENPPEGTDFLRETGPLLEKPENSYGSMVKSMLSYYRGVLKRHGLSEARSRAKIALEEAAAQGNRYQVAKLYHILGYLHQQEEPEAALGYFDQGIELRKELGSIDGLIKAYNGVGYFSFTLGDHDRSLHYFQRSLELLDRTEDFVEICLTLFNISLTYLVGGYFAAALELLQRILEVMKNLQIQSLPWHSRKKLSLVTGLAASYLGWHSLSLEYWESGRQDPLPEDSKAFQLLLKVRVEILREEVQDGDADLTEAFNQAMKDMHGFLAGHILMEKMMLSRRRGDQVQEREWTSKADAIIPRQSTAAQRKLFHHLCSGGRFEDYVPPGGLNPQIRSISLNLVLQARREASSFALSRSLGEISFLKNFQDGVQRDKEEHQNFAAAKEYLLREYPLGEFLVLEESGSEVSALFPAGRLKRALPHWRDFWRSKETAKTKIWEEGEKICLAAPFKAGSQNHLYAYLEFKNSDRLLRDEDLEVIQMALGHLDATLGLSRAHKELTKRITTDMLTGALNRGEFFRLAELERRRCLRYLSTRGRRTFSLLYADLDNFKTVNDTLGHQTGDQILKVFVETLKNCIRDLDLLGRIGGDEFLVLLPETDARGAEVVAQRILSNLREKNPFQTFLYAKKNTSYPVDKIPGCSLGGAEFYYTTQETLTQLVERADKALYRSKNEGKGRATVEPGGQGEEQW